MPIDRKSLNKWEYYSEAKEAMFFFYIDAVDAPWTIIKLNEKRRVRLNCKKNFLYSRPHAQKNRGMIGKPDPLSVGSTNHVVKAVSIS